MSSRRSSFIFAFILLSFISMALLYVNAVPLFEHSDEAEHFIYVHTILERGELPVVQSRQQMQQQADPVRRWNNQAHHAPLYYLLSAAAVSWTERSDLERYLVPNELIFLRNTTENNPNKWLHPYGERTGDTHLAVYTLRLANVLIGMATLALIYRAGRSLAPLPSTALLMMAFVAALPTFLVVHSGVSNDPLTIFFYTAGVTWLLHIWQARRITQRDTLLISVILPGIALTKLTGVSLVGVVYAGLALGAWRGRWSWREVAQVIIISLVASALLAGWWYLRNWQLYGDPLALGATASIWGRESTLTLALFLDDLERIAQSFWFMVGYLHQPVFAPMPFYIYAAFVTLLGVIGVGLVWRADPVQRPLLAWLMLVCGVVLAMLLYGTRSVDISYGRLLLPAILAFAALLVLGWQMLLGRTAGLLIAPLTLLAISAPLTLIPLAYPTLHPVDSLPANAQPLDATIDHDDGTLALLALESRPSLVAPRDTLELTLYLRGNHPQNPALLITAADSLRAQRLGHMEIYPGRAATRSLPADQIYRLTLYLPLDQIPDAAYPPRVVTLLLRWVDLDTNAALAFSDGSDLREINVATFIDERYQPQTLPYTIDVQFGERIVLESYALPQTPITAGDEIALAFNWRPLQNLDAAWVPTIQLLDDSGALVTQTDGLPYWYPARWWAADVAFTDERTFSLPADLPAGEYTVHVGWYRQREDGSFERLPIANTTDNLLPLSPTIAVE